MTEDAAMFLREAESDDRSSSEIWEKIKARNDNVDWDIDRMLSAIDREDE